MVPDRRTEWTDAAKTISLLLRRGIMKHKGFMLTLQVTRSIHDSMNIPKIEFIAYIYILL